MKKALSPRGCLLTDKDWSAMLDAFPRMSAQDQAALFMVIKARAKARPAESQKGKGGAA
jgi:hypothetical protein